ncbi:uncharacterized protein LOC143024739 [Oratosquilla oratoria]|uniref:uncharacterized protein LOC143024739 n=1 Tax=Oratosquilla oratoria TaxID=337810 RepID=UPI003F7696B6
MSPPDHTAPKSGARRDSEPCRQGAAPSVTANASRPSVDRGRSASIDIAQFSSMSSCCSASAHNLAVVAALNRGRHRSSNTFSASSTSDISEEVDEDKSRVRSTSSSSTSSGRSHGGKSHKKKCHHCVVAGGLFPAFKVT